jgi:hypothetical protein
MEKRIINKFGTHYLLGIDKDGDYIWLEKESWDCDWYWGFGYLHTYTNNTNPERAKDLNAHFHFDCTFLKGPDCSKDMFKNYFAETVLTDDEMWILCDLMTTYYTLKKTAELFRHGYSYQTQKAKIDKLQSPMTEAMINKVLLPEVFKKIEQLLTP